MIEVFAIRDEIADKFGSPVVMASEALLRRELQNLITYDSKHVYAMNPSDFVVYHLGSYNEVDASFVLLPHAKRLFSIKDISNND